MPRGHPVVRHRPQGKPGRLPDDVMAETTRDFLLQPSLVTRGWVLDGFPKVVSQVEGLLASDAYLTYKAEMAAASGAKGKPAKGASSRMQQAEVQPVAFSFDERLAPTHVVMLECDDPTMLHR